MSLLNLTSSRQRTARPTPPRRTSLCLLALLLVAGTISSFARAQAAKEYQLKAAFLYNFTRFIEWPEGKIPAQDEPLVIGIWKTNPFGTELQTTIGERKAHGRAIVVRTLSSLEDARDTHLVFITASETDGLKETLTALHAGHVLTVGESRAFSGAAGIITFTLDGNKLRFEINLQSGEQAGLKMSAQLLKLAASVRR